MELDATHSRVVGGALDQIEELIVRAQSLGLRSAAATELEAAIGDLRARLGLTRGEPPPGLVRSLLAEVLVLTHELRPRALKGYGELSPEHASFLADEAERLMELAGRALDELEAEQKTEVR